MSNILKQSQSSPSRILIQKDLPQHKMQSGPQTPETPLPAPVPPVKEKWTFLKSTLESAVNDWSELEKISPQKTAEEEQLDKMRSLISNIKDRLKEF